MQTVIVMLGTKAQFVKLAPLLLELERSRANYRLVYTGQHQETFRQLQKAFGTRSPDLQMVVGMEAATRARFLKWCFAFWRSALSKPYRTLWRSADTIVVHGDTMSTLFGAMVGRLFRVKVAHVEAGLRSPSLVNPFPEEIIRRLVSRFSRLHFCPDEWSRSNLRKVKGRKITTPGNTLLDSLHLALERSQTGTKARPLSNFGIVSLHRVENLSNRDTLDGILETLVQVANTLPLRFVLHPATRETLKKTGWMERLQSVEAIQLQPRTDYFTFVELLLRSRFLMTDGGSNQEEASMIGLPCLLLRKYTERKDGLGETVEISDLDPQRILAFASRHAEQTWALKPLAMASPSRLIAEELTRIVPKDQ